MINFKWWWKIILISQNKSSLWEFNRWWLRIRQNYCVAEFNKTSTTGYSQNLFMHQDPFESKNQLLINGKEKVGIKKLKNPKAFIDYWQTIDDVQESLAEYNPRKKRKVLIVSDDMIADMKANK